MSQITVDVGVKLNVLQSSLADLQNILKHLEPDSSGFKKMQSIIAEMTREMERFQVQTSKGFTSNKQFDQANRSVEKMEETLAKAQIAISNLKFSDIKLNPNQTQAFSALEQAIVSAEQKLDSIKEKTKQGIFSDTTSINTLSALDPKGITKSFDEIDAIVSRGVKDIEGKIINAKAQIEELNSETAVAPVEEVVEEIKPKKEKVKKEKAKKEKKVKEPKAKIKCKVRTMQKVWFTLLVIIAIALA